MDRERFLAHTVGQVKQYTLISPVEATQRFGFRCPVCNLTYQDNLKLIDHFNSPQHQAKAGVSLSGGEHGHIEKGVPRASFAEVVKVMEQLVAIKVGDDPKQDFRLQRRERKKLKKPELVEEKSELDTALGFSKFGKRDK